MAFSRNQPYNNLPLLPPAVDVETKATLKQAIAASRALAELKGAGRLIPNQTVLIRTLGLQEAKLSLEIENIVTTNDELYRAFSGTNGGNGGADPVAKEVLRYNDALWHGYNTLQSGQQLSLALFDELIGIIGVSGGVREQPGTVIANRSGDILYTPPQGRDLITGKLYNLELFLNHDTTLDPLIKLAVAHYQFEAIHPFRDGNGRTGRLLNVLYLVQAGLLDLPVLYLSRYIIANKTAYYDGLRRVTEENAWEEWILFLLRGVEETAQTTRQRIDAIRTLMEETAERVRTELPKIYSRDLIETLFAQPYCKIRFLEEAGIAGRQTASRYLQELSRIGILSPPEKYGRDTYYFHPAFLKLLTE